jgi:type II secretory pathway pseudopilin PulG
MIPPKLIIAAVLALVVAVVVTVIYQAGKDAEKLDQAENYIEGTQDVQDALTDIPTDPDDVLSGLRSLFK